MECCDLDLFVYQGTAAKMEILCAAFNCSNTNKKRIGLSFHEFPLKNEELLGKWLSAIMREKFVPTQHHKICSEHFTESCFLKSKGKRILKYDAVPTIFSCSSYIEKIEEPLQEILIKEAEPEKLEVNVTNEAWKLYPPVKITEEHNYALSLSEAVQKIKSEINRKDMIISTLRSDIMKYKQKCSIQDCRRKELRSAVSYLKEKTLINEHKLHALNNNLPDIMIDIISASREQKSEYSDALKQFARSVYFESPPAYEYVRHTLCKALPQANVVKNWILNENSDVTNDTVASLENQA